MAAAIVLFFAPVWVGHRFLSDGQYAAFFTPLSTWSDAWIGGWPVAADTAAFVWYPLRIAFVWLHLGFNAFVVSAYVIAAIGVYAYLRLARIGWAGAMLGGAGFALSGFMIAHLWHTSMIHASAWIPWMFAGLEGCFVSGRRRWALVSALAVLMSCLAGHVQLTLYGLLLCVIYIFFWLPACLRQQHIRRWGLACAALAIGILLAAPQLLLTLEYLPETPRAKMDYASFISYSLPLWQLPTVLFPFLFGGNGAPMGVPYFGAWNFPELCVCMPFFFFVLALPGAAISGNASRWFWLSVAVGGLLMAMGGEIPLLAKFSYHVPGINMFRVPGRHAMEFCLAISVLAAFGLDRIVNAHPSTLRRIARAGVAAALLAVLASIPSHYVAAIVAQQTAHLSLQPWWKSADIWLGVASIAIGLTMFLLLIADVRHPIFVLAIAAISGLTAFGWLAEWRPFSGASAGVVASAAERDVAARISGSWARVLNIAGGGGSILTPERARILGVPSANWYGPLIPRRASELLQITTAGTVSAQSLASVNAALDVYGVRYVAVEERIVPGQERSDMEQALAAPRWRRIAREGSATIYENLRARPLAWMCTAWSEVSAEVALARLHNDGTFDAGREALVVGLPSGGDVQWDAGTADAHWSGSGSIAAQVNSENGGYVVFAVNDMPGWTATIDGIDHPTFRSDYALLGLPVAAGHHDVRLEYRVSVWRWAVPLVAALACLVATLWLGRPTARVLQSR